MESASPIAFGRERRHITISSLAFFRFLLFLPFSCTVERSDLKSSEDSANNPLDAGVHRWLHENSVFLLVIAVFFTVNCSIMAGLVLYSPAKREGMSS
jgi:hypothetical protein